MIPVWILVAVIAQLVQAVVAILDKYIVTGKKAVIKPFVYAFYSCLVSGGWIIIYLFGLIPNSFFGFSIPSFSNVESPTLFIGALSLIAAYSFFVALVSLFKALRYADASDVVPVVGAVSAIVTLILSALLLDARLSPNFLIGVLLLASGTALVSRFHFNWKTAVTSIHAGIFFAVHFVALKGVFNETTFDNGFFWSRLALVFVALSMLLVPRYCLKIFSQTKQSGTRGGALVLGNKLAAGVASIMILKATELGSVAVVQALGGLQFVFILLIGILLGKKTPKECGENYSCNADIYRKTLFVAIITLGFFVLFV